MGCSQLLFSFSKYNKIHKNYCALNFFANNTGLGYTEFSRIYYVQSLLCFTVYAETNTQIRVEHVNTRPGHSNSNILM